MVVGEEHLRGGQVAGVLEEDPDFAKRLVLGGDFRIGGGGGRADELHVGLEPAALVMATPDPGVPEPRLRQDVNGLGCVAAVGDRDAREDVVGVGLGVLDLHVPMPVVEDAGVVEFELGLLPGACAVLGEQSVVGKLGDGVLVECPHVGVRGRGVQVEVVLLDVLAVVALGTGEAEESFLEDGISAVPEGEGEAESALAIGDAEQAVLSPAIGAAAGVLVGEVGPAGAVGGVVLADGAPLAFGEIGSPALPVLLTLEVGDETIALGIRARIVLRAGGELLGNGRVGHEASVPPVCTRATLARRVSVREREQARGLVDILVASA